MPLRAPSVTRRRSTRRTSIERKYSRSDPILIGELSSPCSLDDVFSFKYQPLAVPYLTPPYIDNLPEVIQRDLHPAGDEELKFVILATDGCESLPYSKF